VPSTSGRNLHVVPGSNAQASAKRLRLRVLIADDDRDTATTLAMVLRDEGDEVHTTLRGDEVLEACRLLRPDVLILDINMPGMSGYAIAHELRERHGTLAPLLIAISGVWTRSSDRLVGTAVGFDHYLLKPCEPKDVLRLIEPLRSASASGVA
jgi:DNA-binding response OmpR family regulator